MTSVSPSHEAKAECRCAFCSFKRLESEADRERFVKGIEMHGVRPLSRERIVEVLEGPCAREPHER